MDMRFRRITIMYHVTKTGKESNNKYTKHCIVHTGIRKETKNKKVTRVKLLLYKFNKQN